MGRLLAYLIDLIFAVLVGKLLSRAFRTLFGTPAGPLRGSANRPAAGPGGAGRETIKGHMARDPVCGMFVSTELSHTLNLDGQTIHFCSQECLDHYQKAEAKAHS